MLSRMMTRHLEARERHPGRILDVSYDALLADPIGTVKRIHDAHALGWSDALELRLRAHLESRQQHRFGKHPYSLEEGGIGRAEVESAFALYRERYLRG